NSGATFVNTPIPVQTGTFTAIFDLQISGLIGANIGLSNGSVTGFSGMACILGVDSGGFFVARNGGAYSSLNFISYTPGVLYHFRLDVDVPAHTYSIYITPEGGSEVVLASNYAFRTEQAAVTQLNNQVITVATAGGWVSVSNFSILIGAPEIVTTTLPSGTVDAVYAQVLAA